MSKKIMALLLAVICIAGIFAGCKSGDESDGTSAGNDSDFVTVTDENGNPVTDKDGKTVTKKNEKPGSESGQNGSGSSDKEASDSKIPYSTTSPGSTISNSTWPFGAWDKVGIVLPEGWERVGDTYNDVKKVGTSFEVVANPKNILGDEYTTAEQCAELQRKMMKKQCKSYKELKYAKEKYKNGAAAQLIAKIKDDEGSRYIIMYIFQEGEDIMIYNCSCTKKSEINTSIEEVIANTCFRG